MSKTKSKLEIGNFYYAYGGEKHPSLVFDYDKIHKTYKAIVFGTSKRKHMTRISPISNGCSEQYVHNRPFEGVRSDFGSKELLGFSINVTDIKLIETIKKKEPNRSRKAKMRYCK